MTTTITADMVAELRAKAEALRNGTNNEMALRMESLRLNAEINRLQDPKYLNALTKASMVKSTTDTLNAVINNCKGIIESMPIFNRTTGENRKWSTNRTVGYGNHIELLTNLLNGIQYSTAEHKQFMLELSGLDSDLIERTLQAFGNPAYYSINNDIVVEAQPYNYNELMECIALIEDKLGVVLNTTDLTEKRMSQRFLLAEVRAKQAQVDAHKTTFVASGLLDLS